MRLKRMSAILLASAAAAVLAACGQNADGQEKESSGSEKKSDGVLSVMTWDDNQAKGLQKILDDFTKETGSRRRQAWSNGMNTGLCWMREPGAVHSLMYSGCIPMKRNAI